MAERPLQPSQLRAPALYKNLLINGDFQIDQRNAGAAKTVNTASWSYCIDRWAAYGQATDGVFTVQQVTSSLPPSGTKNACKITVTTADASIGASQLYELKQPIEGNNISQLMFGTGNAKSLVLSFWTRASVTGTFSGVLKNNAGNRFYIFTFTIGTVDTWEKKIIVIPGEISGIWLSDNGVGLHLGISIGAGSTLKGAVGVWGTTEYRAATGSVDLISTLNATLYLADVQLEAGSGASDFERLTVDAVFNRCQRYYIKGYLPSQTPGQASATPVIQVLSDTFGYGVFNFRLPTEMRGMPVFTPYANITGNSGYFTNSSYAGTPDCTASFGGTQTTAFGYMYNNQTGTGGYWLRGNYTIDAEL